MGTTRYKGATAGERLNFGSVSDSDMIQLRHKPGTINDADKGISKSELLSCPFGVSSTAAGTIAKTASLTDSNPDFTLVSGREVVVCFTTQNTAVGPTLNFAGTGAIPMYMPNGAPVGAWVANTWMHLKYFSATVGGSSISRWILLSPDVGVEVITATGKTIKGRGIISGSVVRIQFTSNITGSNTTSALSINYNGTAYPVKVGKNGTVADFVASNINGSYIYCQAYTTLELRFNGSQFVILGNPVVYSTMDYTIYADGRHDYKLIIENANFTTSGSDGFITIGQRQGYKLVSIIGNFGKSIDLVGNNAGDYYAYVKDWIAPIASGTSVTVTLVWIHS